MSPVSIRIRLTIRLLLLIALLGPPGGCTPVYDTATGDLINEKTVIIPDGMDKANAGDKSVWSAAVAVSSDIVPAERLYDWGAYCGIPGGIPQRTTIYRTLSPGATAADINAAIAACPSGQVVYLSAGTYDLGTGRIQPGIRIGVTLRGAGPGKTIIRSTGSNVIRQDGYAFNEVDGISITGGFVKGSRSIVLASAPSSRFATGGLIAITENSSPNKFAPNIGDYARDGLTSSAPSLTASRCFRFVTRITSVSGNTVNLATPLPLSFTASLAPKAYPQSGTGVMSMFGFEDMTFDGCGDAIRLYQTDRCWFKNLEFNNCPGNDIGHIQLYNSVQPEIRGCYVHDVPNWPENTEGTGFGIYYGTCNGLFIDNISNKTACQFLLAGCAANAFIYNYAKDCSRGTTPVVMPQFQYHGPQGLMNLIEANIGPGYTPDAYHGSASHDTLYRNHFNGLCTGRTNDRRVLNLCRGSYYINVVGNVIGDASWTPTGYEGVGGFAHTDSFIYVLGYPNSGNTSMVPAMPWSTHPNVYPDPAVKSTILRHGNYDYYHRDVVWDAAIAARAISVSLFFSSKPAFFGSLQWPPIGPDVAGLVTDIPARARWNTYSTSGDIGDLFDKGNPDSLNGNGRSYILCRMSVLRHRPQRLINKIVAVTLYSALNCPT